MDPNNLYREWLVSLVDGDRADRYPTVINAAWDMEFIYSIPTDANRAQDGIDLRRVFERETSHSLPDLGPCRVLEFLVALSKRIDYILYDYEYQDQTDRWFWEMMANLRLIDLGSHNTREPNRKVVDSILQRVIDRTYDDAGYGGLFPLRHPKEDQRTVEVWYQMHLWIAERQNRMV